MSYPALGIDVAKATLAVTLALTPQQQVNGEFSNDAAGYVRLARWCQRLLQQASLATPGVRVCLEATGRYSDGVAQALYGAEWVAQVSVLNPTCIHAYGRSQLRRSKSDKGDAQLLAHYAATQDPSPWTPPAPQQQTLQELNRHRDNLLTQRQQLRNRRKAGVRSDVVLRQLQAQEELLEQQLADVDREIKQTIAQVEQLHATAQLIRSIGGVGPVLTATVLAEVPDLLRFADGDQLAAYAGVVPTQHDSGTSVKRKSKLAKNGNVHLRKALYMPALSAARHNPVIRAFAERLKAKGKSKMTIVGAVMHKLICLIYGVVKSNRPFDPNYATASPIT